MTMLLTFEIFGRVGSHGKMSPNLYQTSLTLFDIGGGGGGHDASQNVFDHCAQTLRERKLKLGDFYC